MVPKRKGRPRIVVGTPQELKLREHWRDARAKYYKKNKAEILENARVKKDVKCKDCGRMIFDPYGKYVYVCRTINKIDENPLQLRDCRQFRPRERGCRNE